MSIALSKGTPVTLKSALTVVLVSVAYLIVSYFLVGYKSDQLVLVGIFCSLYFSSGITRKFILGFSIFIVYWIIFDYMKAFPNYNYNPVHIADLYNTEKHLFGIKSGNLLLTPNEYWWIHHLSFLDVLTGIFYLCWIPVPLAFAAYLFFTNRNQFLRFSLTFVLVNLLGFVVYYTYPAAPPWYVHFNGFTFHAHTPGNTAGLARFDAFFGVTVFKSIYAKGSNVFAAMPSLHSSYPLIVFYYGIKNRLGLINAFFAIVMVGIWFAAVYTSHHYVMDVMAGITCAAIGILLFNYLSTKWRFLREALLRYEAIIR
ncbi:inositol phosphorylceramide synthase [Mucilaginibacter sp. Bleaf8]|uniref:phosphatase PAP2 family protein n=1 Tax=Mucilaginibacter sp. Bleaf8 TaxID=2834430 RepID=UPI001BD07F7D|nr:phosphatase PAP2 family protein [Mucilaginibacter sp. Bleaf8]MBS7563053.1 inositol phosphorylceramide synthase [Mucilaginibacter sp. Bleaf8]